MEHSQYTQYIDVLKRLRSYAHKHGLVSSYRLFNQLLDVVQKEAVPISTKETGKISAAIQALKDSTCSDRLYAITAEKMDGAVDDILQVGTLNRFVAIVATDCTELKQTNNY